MQLTADAQRMLDDYLRRADTHLRGASVGDAEEVERELREHVERELQEAPQPVSARDLQAVLERLGSPADLVPEEELSWWRRAALRWQTGPEDWRLAYLSIGLLVLAGWAGGLGIVGSFFVSRAALEVAGDEEDLGPKKWLLYPSLILVYVPLAALLFLGPLWSLIMAMYAHTVYIRGGGLGAAGGSPSATFLLLPVWWLALIALARRYPRFLPTLFRPFVKTEGAGPVLRVVGICLLLFVLYLAVRVGAGLMLR